MANISIEVVLGILLFSLLNINVKVTKKELELRRYTNIKALSTKKRVELVNCKKFATVALDLKEDIFVVHIALLEI